MKKCCNCGEMKTLQEFGRLKGSKDGYRYDCKLCKRERSRLYRLKNKKPKKEKYSYPLRTICCIQCGIEITGNFCHVKKFCSQICSNRNKNEKNYAREAKKKWILQNPIKRKESTRRSRLKNYYKPENILTRKNYSQRIEIKLKNALRSRIRKFITTEQKKTSTTKIVGCSSQELKSYLESKFDSRMNWNNWSQFGWHIDHIIPLSSAKTLEEFYKLCHYTNLQPLWWDENIKKRDKIIG